LSAQLQKAGWEATAKRVERAALLLYELIDVNSTYNKVLCISCVKEPIGADRAKIISACVSFVK